MTTRITFRYKSETTGDCVIKWVLPFMVGGDEPRSPLPPGPPPGRTNEVFDVTTPERVHMFCKKVIFAIYQFSHLDPASFLADMQHGRGLLQTGQVIQDIARDVTTCPINMALVLDKLWDTEDDADMLCLTSSSAPSIFRGPISIDGHSSILSGFELSFSYISESTSSEVQSDNSSSEYEQHQHSPLDSEDDIYAAKVSIMAKAGTLPDPGLSSAVPVPGLDDADDELAALQLMVTSQDSPFGWEFDGTDAKLSDIFVDISTRNMTPHERAAFMQGKRKELTEFFGNDVWESHKPTGEEDPRRILKAKWVLKWTKNDDGAPRAKARLAHFKVPKDAAELMGIEPNTLMKLIKRMYGQVDAPRRWWLRAVDDLKASGLKQHPLDPCAFLSFDEDGNNDGFILLYVDDMLGGKLTQTPHWENPKSNSSEIEVKMATYVKNLEPITIEANETLRFYKQNSDVGLKIKKIGQVCDIVFVAMTDAAWGVRLGGSSQGGYVVLACHKKIFDGHESDFSVIDWKSFKLLRMARSSLHAESQAAAAGMDGWEFAMRFWAALIYDGVDITKDESTRMAGEPALVVDAKALYDAAQKESIASFQDKRTGIEVLALRGRMEATMTRWRWVSSERQCADGLAKIAARQLLADRLRHGWLQLKHDPNYPAAKKKTKEERQDSIDQTRPAASAATRKATTPFMQLAVFAICCCRSAAHSGCDAKNENIAGAEFKCKTELAVLRAKAEKERIEKVRDLGLRAREAGARATEEGAALQSELGAARRELRGTLCEAQRAEEAARQAAMRRAPIAAEWREAEALRSASGAAEAAAAALREQRGALRAEERELLGSLGRGGEEVERQQETARQLEAALEGQRALLGRRRARSAGLHAELQQVLRDLEQDDHQHSRRCEAELAARVALLEGEAQSARATSDRCALSGGCKAPATRASERVDVLGLGLRLRPNSPPIGLWNFVDDAVVHSEGIVASVRTQMVALAGQLVQSFAEQWLPISDKTTLVSNSGSLGRGLESDLKATSLPISRTAFAVDLGWDTTAGARRVVRELGEPSQVPAPLSGAPLGLRARWVVPGSGLAGAGATASEAVTGALLARRAVGGPAPEELVGRFEETTRAQLKANRDMSATSLPSPSWLVKVKRPEGLAVYGFRTLPSAADVLAGIMEAVFLSGGVRPASHANMPLAAGSVGGLAAGVRALADPAPSPPADAPGGALALPAAALGAAAPPLAAADLRVDAVSIDVRGDRWRDFLEGAASPTAWHTNWMVEGRIAEGDPITREHGLLCRILELTVGYDQVNMGELAHLEMTARRLFSHVKRSPLQLPDVRGLDWASPASTLPASASWAGMGLSPEVSSYMAAADIQCAFFHMGLLSGRRHHVFVDNVALALTAGRGRGRAAKRRVASRCRLMGAARSSVQELDVISAAFLARPAERWPLWAALKLARHGGAALRGFDAADVRGALDQATGRLGSEAQPSLHVLRHSAASDDLPAARFSLPEAKDAGRWIADCCLRRSAKRAKLQRQMDDLPDEVTSIGQLVDAHLGALIEAAALGMPFPRPVPVRLAVVNDVMTSVVFASRLLFKIVVVSRGLMACPVFKLQRSVAVDGEEGGDTWDCGFAWQAVMDFVVGFPATAQKWWLDVTVRSPLGSALFASSRVAGSAAAVGDNCKNVRYGAGVRSISVESGGRLSASAATALADLAAASQPYGRRQRGGRRGTTALALAGRVCALVVAWCADATLAGRHLLAWTPRSVPPARQHVLAVLAAASLVCVVMAFWVGWKSSRAMMKTLTVSTIVLGVILLAVALFARLYSNSARPDVVRVANLVCQDVHVWKCQAGSSELEASPEEEPERRLLDRAPARPRPQRSIAGAELLGLLVILKYSLPPITASFDASFVADGLLERGRAAAAEATAAQGALWRRTWRVLDDYGGPGDRALAAKEIKGHAARQGADRCAKCAAQVFRSPAGVRKAREVRALALDEVAHWVGAAGGESTQFRRVFDGGCEGCKKGPLLSLRKHETFKIANDGVRCVMCLRSAWGVSGIEELYGHACDHEAFAPGAGGAWRRRAESARVGPEAEDGEGAGAAAAGAASGSGSQGVTSERDLRAISGYRGCKRCRCYAREINGKHGVVGGECQPASGEALGGMRKIEQIRAGFDLKTGRLQRRLTSP
ncbi:unnamed protein product [Prorocentrum cordatum]|uniref:Uncharacterized protein n=1 Tax=Prorocentrum cordatum TaxID=2364126 RepID=A0ABN9RNL5_9DINO|nr:unnamed protein product [Polarella glacialis]